VAVSHSAYALDFFGFGESARGAARYSMESQAALVASFMDEMGINRVALVGHGLGGLVGLHFAVTHPGRVARMLVAGLSPCSTPAYESLLTLEPDQLLTLLDTKGQFTGELLPETRAIDPAALRLIPELEDIQRSLSALGAAGSPILIINGSNDPLQPSAAPGQWPGPDPQPHEIVVPESGHFPMLDASDSFHRLMIDFLALENGTNVHELRLKEEWRRRMR
jgi:pimeloyl-ACP methyl ester carboxylesterase